MEIFLITITLVIGFYMLWNMGANDVSNAMGTSVGSGAVTMRRAILIAATLEFAGAFTLGSNVSETLQSGIISPAAFDGQPLVLVFGMVSALLATALWIQIATIFRWPVSTTHSIVGAIVGFGIVAFGVSAIDWLSVTRIALSWIVSPTLSAFAAFFLFKFVQRHILFAYNPLLATKKIAPYLVFFVLATFMISTITHGLKNLRIDFSFHWVLLITIFIGGVGAIIGRIACKKIHLDSQVNPMLSFRLEQQLYSLGKVKKHLLRAKLSSTGKTSDELGLMSEGVSQIIEDVKNKSKWESHLSADYTAVERIFAGLQLLSACFVAFAHGANDVSNAVGPMSAIFSIIANPESLAKHAPVPIWLLAFGGLGIVIGLATYGWRVIETIGKNITHLTPSRGFCAEFAAAATILFATKLGLPISTTHAIVGAVLGVGLARGLSSLNILVIRDIFLSWIITLPSSAIITVLLFLGFKAIFL
jgi:inorganic phosphate transporter, PiT family